MNKKRTAFIIVVLLIGAGFTSISQASVHPDDNSLHSQQIMERNDVLFDCYVRILMRIAHKPSIAAGIIINDTLVWSKGYGLYDIEKNKQATSDTLYLQASVSKTVTATALMQLYDAGLVGLDDDVNTYLPFPLRNPNHPDIPITVRMLLSHRSSLADDNLYWLCLSYLPGDPDVPDWPDPWLREYLTPGGTGYSPNIWSTAKPGEEYYYANVGFSLIGYIIERLTGQSFNEYCKEHIFTPLQMYNTSFRLRDLDIGTIAVPYEYKNFNYHPHPHYGMYVIHPAASLRTSVKDYSHFIIAHMNGGVWNGVQILSQSAIEMMHKAWFSPEDKYNYGLGWQIARKNFGKIEISHSGGWPGVHTWVVMEPDKDTGVILFSNCLDSELGATWMESSAFVMMKNLLFIKAKRVAS